ncbi:MAG TPA: hypothetical protein VJH95_02185 [Candidatus Nanoarchaeia archaeon]|nr:hypothetical protein [Candidatus Nanoarchaeia archaeon]
MKSLVFDSSSVISIMTNNLMDVLFELKKRFNGEFFIPDAVKLELVDNPLRTRRFELQAVMLADYIGEGYFKFFENIAVKSQGEVLTETANNIFMIDGKALRIVDSAEICGLVLANMVKASAYVVDERTLRLLVEDYRKLKELFERKFNARVEVDRRSLKKFQEVVGGVKIIRSAELMTLGFELGLFNKYKSGGELVDGYKQRMLEGILWGLRLRGCSISTNEINEILKIEKVNGR